MRCALRKYMVGPLVLMGKRNRTIHSPKRVGIFGIMQGKRKPWLHRSASWWLRPRGLSNGLRVYTLRSQAGILGSQERFHPIALFGTPLGIGLFIWVGSTVYCQELFRGSGRVPSRVWQIASRGTSR